MNRVLIVGAGSREHALGWKLAQSPKVKKIYFVPGNAGTAQIGENIDIGVLKFEKIAKFAKKEIIDLVVVGPDDPLALGIVDYLQKRKIKVFGPTKAAAQIEASKAFAKKLMKEENIPTAKWESFKDFSLAKKYLLKQSLPIVIKASGLALGKGVIIAKTKAQASRALEGIMIKKIFGDAGKEVVIEEFLEGQEISLHVFSDGESYSIFPTSQDHKQIFDQDKGPNTGGMGQLHQFHG